MLPLPFTYIGSGLFDLSIESEFVSGLSSLMRRRKLFDVSTDLSSQ